MRVEPLPGKGEHGEFIGDLFNVRVRARGCKEYGHHRIPGHDLVLDLLIGCHPYNDADLVSSDVEHRIAGGAITYTCTRRQHESPYQNHNQEKQCKRAAHGLPSFLQLPVR